MLIPGPMQDLGAGTAQSAEELSPGLPRAGHRTAA